MLSLVVGLWFNWYLATIQTIKSYIAPVGVYKLGLPLWSGASIVRWDGLDICQLARMLAALLAIAGGMADT